MIYSFSDCELDTARRELRRAGTAVHVEPQVFDLVVHLVNNRHRIVTKDEILDAVWGGRIVSDSTLSSRVSVARQVLGDRGSAGRLIVTHPRRGFRFAAEVAARDPSGAPSGGGPDRPEHGQEIAFVRAADGVRLAYGSVGKGPVVVKASNWMNHVETDFRNPIWAELFTRIASTHRLIHYDGRGAGLSDWKVDEISFEASVGDLETIVEASGAERVSLLGMSMGAATAMAYAARHPHRVDKLVLHGSFAVGRRRRLSNADAEKAELLLSLMRNGWGTTDSAFMRAFACLYFPHVPMQDLGWFVDLQNRSATAENATRVRDACDNLDVSGELEGIAASTLVLHSRADLVVPLDQGRAVAAAIPGARFVPLDTENHLVMPTDPAWPRFIEAIERHLAA